MSFRISEYILKLQMPIRYLTPPYPQFPDTFDFNPIWEDTKSFDFQAKKCSEAGSIVTGIFHNPPTLKQINHLPQY